ncbi:hypothetical protein STENM223S_07366 [Streptomyces tendae]
MYAPAIEGAPDTVGRERYARWSRYCTTARIWTWTSAYAYGWAERTTVCWPR